MGAPARPLPGRLDLTEEQLRAQPALEGILIEHASRGVRVQLVVRALLVAFVCLVVLIIPPKHDRGAAWAVAAVYAIWSLVVARLARSPDRRVLRLAWLALLVDLAALAALTIVAAASVRESWTADVLIEGCFVLPVLAATSLRPRICTAVAVPTLVVYFISSVVSRHANGEPWSSVALRTLAMAAVCLGCVLLSRVQRSRVQTIGGLVADRGALLDELVSLQARERAALAEALHDGALQYVLAARQDLPEAPDELDGDTLSRLDHALTRAGELLRFTVAELHPAVLEQAGLVAATRQLATAAGARAGFQVSLDVSGWPADTRTSADAVLFALARELLGNVAKHAGARAVWVTLSAQDGRARLTVRDDGRGIDVEQLDSQLARGHVGIASQRTRLEATGGGLTVAPGPSGGTLAQAQLPLTPAPAGATTV